METKTREASREISRYLIRQLEEALDYHVRQRVTGGYDTQADKIIIAVDGRVTPLGANDYVPEDAFLFVTGINEYFWVGVCEYHGDDPLGDEVKVLGAKNDLVSRWREEMDQYPNSLIHHDLLTWVHNICTADSLAQVVSFSAERKRK